MNNQTTTVAYDYEGRITQITYPNNSTNTFTYNGLDTRVGKVDSAGTKTFKRDGAGVTDSVLSDGSSTFTPGISSRTSGATSFLLGDLLKSFTRETDSTQTTTATKQYDAFGALVASTGASNSPFGFAGGFGYQEDNDSGLKLLGHRYYDSSTGRFLTRDPVKDGSNWYVYCENNPVSGADPSGLTMILGFDFTTAGFCEAMKTAAAGLVDGLRFGWGNSGINDDRPGYWVARVSGSVIAICGVIAVIELVAIPVYAWVTGGAAAAGKQAQQAIAEKAVRCPWDSGTVPATDNPPSGWARGGPKQNYTNPGDYPGNSLRPDLDHPDPIGPHWDWITKGSPKQRIPPGPWPL